MKKGRIISSMLVLIMASGFVLSGCGKADAKYFAKVSQYSFWDNQGAESIPQYQYYHIMDQDVYKRQHSHRFNRSNG